MQTKIKTENQLQEAFQLINSFIEELDLQEGKIKYYPDLPADLEALQDFIKQAEDTLTSLAESVEETKQNLQARSNYLEDLADEALDKFTTL